VQDDLEVSQLAVDVVVDLAAHPLRIRLSGREQLLGLPGRLAHDLGARHHACAFGPGGLQHLFGLRLPLGDHRALLAQQAFGRGDLGGQQLANLLDVLQDLAPVDHAGGRHRHRAGALHQRRQLVELGVHVHGLAFRLCRSVGQCASRLCSRRRITSGTSPDTSPP